MVELGHQPGHALHRYLPRDSLVTFRDELHVRTYPASSIESVDASTAGECCCRTTRVALRGSDLLRLGPEHLEFPLNSKPSAFTFDMLREISAATLRSKIKLPPLPGSLEAGAAAAAVDVIGESLERQLGEPASASGQVRRASTTERVFMIREDSGKWSNAQTSPHCLAADYTRCRPSTPDCDGHRQSESNPWHVSSASGSLDARNATTVVRSSQLNALL